METRGNTVRPDRFIVGIERNGAALIVRSEWYPGACDDLIVLARFESMSDAMNWRDEQQARCDDIARRHCDTCD